MENKNTAKLWNFFSRFYDGFMSLNDKIYAEIIDLIKSEIKPESEILEAAAGTCKISLAVAEQAKKIAVTDFSPKMLEIAKKKAKDQKIKNLDFTVQDIYNLNFADERFDIVIAANVLHIIARPQNALASLKKVLKKDGLLILPTFVLGESFVSRIISVFLLITGIKFYNKWSYEGFKAFLQQNGLVIIQEKLIKGKMPLAYITARKESKKQLIFNLS